MKNQLNDPRFGFTNGLKSIEEYLNIEDGMVLENENFIANFNYLKKTNSQWC